MIHKIPIGELEMFEFNSLTEDAKEHAIEKHREFEYEIGYVWMDDAIKSLQAFVEKLGGNLSNYSIDLDDTGRSSIDVTNIPGMALEDLKETIAELEADDNGLTGYCADYDLIAGAKEYIDDCTEDDWSAREAIMAGYHTWLYAARQDWEYQISDEGVTESIEANEYLFDNDGDMLDVTHYVKDNKVVRIMFKFGGKEYDITKYLSKND